MFWLFLLQWKSLILVCICRGSSCYMLVRWLHLLGNWNWSIRSVSEKAIPSHQAGRHFILIFTIKIPFKNSYESGRWFIIYIQNSMWAMKGFQFMAPDSQMRELTYGLIYNFLLALLCIELPVCSIFVIILNMPIDENTLTLVGLLLTKLYSSRSVFNAGRYLYYTMYHFNGIWMISDYLMLLYHTMFFYQFTGGLW